MRAILILVLVALLAAITPSLAQTPAPGQGGGQSGGGAAQHKQKLGETLDRLQKNAKIKTTVSSKMREKLTQRNPPDLEQRMVAVNAILDQVSKMNDATWKVKRDTMVEALFQQMHVKQGGSGSGGGGKKKNKGGGGQ